MNEKRNTWDSIKKKAVDNPTLIILAMLLGAFSTGWAVRDFFEKREIG